MSFSFHNSDLTWDAVRKTRAKAAILALNGVKKSNGQQLVTATWLPDNDMAADVRITLKDAAGTNGHSNTCSLPFAPSSIWISKNYQPNSFDKFYWQVPAHEMLHQFGGQHAGRYDDTWSNNWIPRVATCIGNHNDFRNTSELTRDDRAYLSWLWDGLGDRQLHANVGFENGTLDWSEVGSATLGWKNSGGSQGPSVAHWTSSGLVDTLQQTIRIWAGDDDESYRARVSAKETNASYKTNAKVDLWMRPLTLTGSDNGCEYADDLEDLDGGNDPNSVPSAGTWVKRASSSAEVGAAWTQVNTSRVNPTSAHGYDVRVEFGGFSLNGNTQSLMLVDDLRVDGT